MRKNFRIILSLILSLPAVLFLPTDLLAEDLSLEKPLSLEECIQTSLTASPDVIVAQQRIEQAQAAVKQAQSGFYPRLAIRETFMRTDFAPMVFSNQLAQGNLTGSFPMPFPPGFDPFGQFNNPGPLSNWNTQLSVQWPLFQGGRTLYGSRAAAAQLTAAELTLRTVHSNLAFSVAAAYYGILRAQNSIGIAEESVRQIQSHLDIARARLENEVALKADVLRVTVRLAEAEEALETARHNLERAKSQLNLAMGRPVNAWLELADEGMPAKSYGMESGDTLEGLMESAHQNRTEIEAMDRSLLSLEHAVDAAKAAYYPQVSAFGHYDIDTEDFSDSNDSWTVGIGADLSIFDGFLTRSTVRAARARLSEAEAQKRQLLLHVDMEVKNAYLAKAEAARRKEVLRDSTAEAEETVRIVSERYSEGLALVTELLDAEVALTNTRLHLLSAEYDHLVAAAALDRAVGRIVGEGTLK